MTRVVLGGVVLVSLAWAQVWLAHLRVNNAHARDAVQRQIEQEQRTISKLSLEYANLTRPERLRKLAHERLGMVAPKPEQLIRQ